MFVPFDQYRLLHGPLSRRGSDRNRTGVISRVWRIEFRVDYGNGKASGVEDIG